MIPILSGNVASALPTGYEVANSCRFDRASSAYLSKTQGAGSRRKATFSCWWKGAYPSAYDEQMFMSSGGDHNCYGAGAATGTMRINTGTGDYAYTNRYFRDPTAWYHMVWAVDTEQSTAADRMKLYINGIQVTSFSHSSYPSEDEDLDMNQTGETFYIARSATTSYGDFMLAEVVWIDGSQLTASSFGEFDEDSPTIWKPIDVSGLTFGTNGFYLDFEDSANLGNDANGGTDLTEANLAAADQCKDSPTNSFCTMNPLNNYYPGGTLSEGNTNVVTGSSSYTFLTGTIGVSTGKWYYEAKIIDEGTHANVGIATKPPYTTNIYPGFEPNDYFYKSTDGNSYTSDAGSSYGNTYTTNDIIGVYIDLDNSKLYFAKNGTVQNSGTGISITTPAAASIDFSSESGQPGSGFYFPAVGDYSGSDTSTFALNFGNGQFAGTAVSSGNADANSYGNFEYDPSSGTFDSASKNFLAICTKNLAEHG